MYLMGVLESIHTELALYCSKNKCARTDIVFLSITEVCNGTVSLNTKFALGLNGAKQLGLEH